MDRKEFIKTCGFACIGGSGLALLLESCTGTNYFAKTTNTANQIIIPKIEFINKSGKKIADRELIIVRHEKYNFPICVFKLDEENYSALLMQCTHKGCELRPQGNYLACPCHGSEFNNKGVVQNPPAEQNLQTFNTRTDSKYVYVTI